MSQINPVPLLRQFNGSNRWVEANIVLKDKNPFVSGRQTPSKNFQMAEKTTPRSDTGKPCGFLWPDGVEDLKLWHIFPDESVDLLKGVTSPL
jgi:hypothetical protein